VTFFSSKVVSLLDAEFLIYWAGKKLTSFFYRLLPGDPLFFYVPYVTVLKFALLTERKFSPFSRTSYVLILPPDDPEDRAAFLIRPLY